jgi:hypothetical protein
LISNSIKPLFSTFYRHFFLATNRFIFSINLVSHPKKNSGV